MEKRDQNLKKVYDQTASAIFKLHSKNTLSEEEMRFLLNFLDLVVKRENRELVNIIRDWNNQDTTSEIDDIVIATLLNLEFNDSTSLDHTKKLIEELLLSCHNND